LFRLDGSLSLNDEKPTVPPGFNGARLEKSSCVDRLLEELGLAFDFDVRMPIFCNCPRGLLAKVM
jgi:hypothetical protein